MYNLLTLYSIPVTPTKGSKMKEGHRPDHIDYLGQLSVPYGIMILRE